jgi:rubrerythrin
MKLDSVGKILDFAIQKEQDAADFYTDLAEKVDKGNMKDVFLGYAAEERGHKAKLMKIKDNEHWIPAGQKILDMKIGDNLVDVEMTSGLSYQDALILAMKAEKAAFKLYSDLAAATDNDGLKSILLGLAQEEAKHKLRFELEYEERFMPDN